MYIRVSDEQTLYACVHVIETVAGPEERKHTMAYTLATFAFSRIRNWFYKRSPR